MKNLNHIATSDASPLSGHPGSEVLFPVISHLSPEAKLAWAMKRIRRLEADLNECREYLETEMDVVDGDYGEPSPNRAMRLVNMIDETMHGPGNF